ncbi:MAG: APC family permease, partial [Ktedonobacteraceae bacterium]|nr:APC family permease [Ktedonobacteraceae bacterium]
IGAYHVFMALSRMEFLPGGILKRNKLRNTPHFAIALATGIPIIILIVVKGNITELGDMYAFGLLGAFSLTCLGLDIVRYRDWHRAISRKLSALAQVALSNDYSQLSDETAAAYSTIEKEGRQQRARQDSTTLVEEEETFGFWFKVSFFLGILTTFLVIIAWSTNLVTKPLATAFGGGVTVLGLLVAYINYTRQQKAGRVPVPVVVTRLDERTPTAVLAVLSPDNPYNDAVIRAAVHSADAERPLIFLYLGRHKARETAPRMLEIVDPYLEDQQAKECFGKAESQAQHAKVPSRRYVYLQDGPDLVTQIWQLVHPHDTVIPSSENERFQDINPDRVRYEVTPNGKVAHLIKTW